MKEGKIGNTTVWTLSKKEKIKFKRENNLIELTKDMFMFNINVEKVIHNGPIYKLENGNILVDYFDSDGILYTSKTDYIESLKFIIDLLYSKKPAHRITHLIISYNSFINRSDFYSESISQQLNLDPSLPLKSNISNLDKKLKKLLRSTHENNLEQFLNENFKFIFAYVGNAIIKSNPNWTWAPARDVFGTDEPVLMNTTDKKRVRLFWDFYQIFFENFIEENRIVKISSLNQLQQFY
jgi:hypothetical protein